SRINSLVKVNTKKSSLENNEDILVDAVDLNKTISLINKNFDLIVEKQNYLLEEVNILWWLFAEFSNDVNKKFSEISAKGACLIAAKELSDLTNGIIFPPSYG